MPLRVTNCGILEVNGVYYQESLNPVKYVRYSEDGGSRHEKCFEISEKYRQICENGHCRRNKEKVWLLINLMNNHNHNHNNTDANANANANAGHNNILYSNVDCNYNSKIPPQNNWKLLTTNNNCKHHHSAGAEQQQPQPHPPHPPTVEMLSVYNNNNNIINKCVNINMMVENQNVAHLNSFSNCSSRQWIIKKDNNYDINNNRFGADNNNNNNNDNNDENRNLCNNNNNNKYHFGLNNNDNNDNDNGINITKMNGNASKRVFLGKRRFSDFSSSSSSRFCESDGGVNNDQHENMFFAGQPNHKRLKLMNGYQMQNTFITNSNLFQ